MAKLAVCGGAPIRTKSFPPWPIYNERELKAVQEVIGSRKWGFLPDGKIKEFETKFAKLHDSEYGILLPNGTITLEIALRVLGVGFSDEVIIPGYDFISSVSAVLMVGAVPVIVDVNSDSYCIDPMKVEEAITSRTKAIIAVHIGGRLADLDVLKETASSHKIPLIEDCAQVHLAEWKGIKVGSFGEFGSFSFETSKLMPSGEGGILITDDKELAERCYYFRNHGRDFGGKYNKLGILGGNYHFTELQSAILLCQLERIQQQVALREENAKFLSQVFSEMEGIQPLPEDPRVTQYSYYRYTFKYLKEKWNGLPREKFIKTLQTEGIPCHPPWRLPHLICQEVGIDLNYSRIHCPVSEKASLEEAVLIPQNVLLATKEDIRDIVRAIKKVFTLRYEIV